MRLASCTVRLLLILLFCHSNLTIELSISDASEISSPKLETISQSSKETVRLLKQVNRAGKVIQTGRELDNKQSGTLSTKSATTHDSPSLPQATQLETGPTKQKKAIRYENRAEKQRQISQQLVHGASASVKAFAPAKTSLRNGYGQTYGTYIEKDNGQEDMKDIFNQLSSEFHYSGRRSGRNRGLGRRKHSPYPSSTDKYNRQYGKRTFDDKEWGYSNYRKPHHSRRNERERRHQIYRDDDYDEYDDSNDSDWYRNRPRSEHHFETHHSNGDQNSYSSYHTYNNIESYGDKGGNGQSIQHHTIVDHVRVSFKRH